GQFLNPLSSRIRRTVGGAEVFDDSQACDLLPAHVDAPPGGEIDGRQSFRLLMFVGAGLVPARVPSKAIQTWMDRISRMKNFSLKLLILLILSIHVNCFQ